jgi:hypothetical protein
VLKRDKIDQKQTDSALSEKRKTTPNNYTQEKNLIERKKMAECRHCHTVACRFARMRMHRR